MSDTPGTDEPVTQDPETAQDFLKSLIGMPVTTIGYDPARNLLTFILDDRIRMDIEGGTVSWYGRTVQ